MTDEVLRKIHSEMHLSRLFLQALVRILSASSAAEDAEARREARRLFGEGGNVVPLRKDG